MTYRKTMPEMAVIFRKDRGKDATVTAVFPTEPASYHYGEMTCYSHVGQHSGCSHNWYIATRAANPAEYADLLAELRQIYEQDEDQPVKLVVRQRITRQMQHEYRRNYKRIFDAIST